jgi:hypothetical protein
VPSVFSVFIDSPFKMDGVLLLKPKIKLQPFSCQQKDEVESNPQKPETRLSSRVLRKTFCTGLRERFFLPSPRKGGHPPVGSCKILPKNPYTRHPGFQIFR